jgi:GNAT superfamily N-acetyltransferase
MLVRRTDRHRLPSSPRGQQPGRTPESGQARTPPGLLALRNQVAVGWCRVTPRYAAPGLERAFQTRHVDDVPIWSISCVYICKGHRRKGIMTALISAAIECRDAHVGALRVVRSVAERIGGTPGDAGQRRFHAIDSRGVPPSRRWCRRGHRGRVRSAQLLDKDPCTTFLVQVVCDNDRS